MRRRVHRHLDTPRSARRATRARFLLPLALLLGFAAFVAPAVLSIPRARADGPHIDRVTFDEDVNPASAHYLIDAISTANSDGANLLLITLDTPGGDLDSMKNITEAELASNIPIVVYIAPPGGRAGSAGTFIALAAPFVAMAPDTRIGAASPIDSSGQDIGPTLDRKIKNDLEALITDMQTDYGRNVADAVSTVENAQSFPVSQAVDDHLVNIEADTQTDLLAAINGQPVTLANKSVVTISIAGEPVQTLQPTFANQLEAVFLDPNVLFLLFIVAAVCIYLELSHPGAIVPGTVGAICLILFLFGAGSLSPNWTGLVLMLLAILLLAVDVRAHTHGVLTLGGLISLVAGSLIFFDSGVDTGVPTVSPVLVISVAVGMGLLSLLVITYAIRLRRRPVGTGAEGLIGQTAVVLEPLAPSGRVRVLGEDWAAELDALHQQKGERVDANGSVRVLARRGLILIVEPLYS